jgi:hypothetical protein
VVLAGQRTDVFHLPDGRQITGIERLSREA